MINIERENRSNCRFGTQLVKRHSDQSLDHTTEERLELFWSMTSLEGTPSITWWGNLWMVLLFTINCSDHISLKGLSNVFVFVIVFVFVFVIVFFSVRSCLLITLIKCIKGHKCLGSLFEGALLMYLSLSSSLSLSCLFFGQVMCIYHSIQMSQRSKVSGVAV